MTNFTTKQYHNPQAVTVGSTSDPSNIWYPNLGAFHHVTVIVENIQQCSVKQNMVEVQHACLNLC